MRRIAAERHTILFLAGLGILVTGIAKMSVPGAYIILGLVICTGACLRAIQSERERQRRHRQDVDLG